MDGGSLETRGPHDVVHPGHAVATPLLIIKYTQSYMAAPCYVDRGVFWGWGGVGVLVMLFQGDVLKCIIFSKNGRNT